MLVGRGRIIAAELKAEVGRATPTQLAWLDAFQTCGAEAHLWRPPDLPAIPRLLSGGRSRYERIGSSTWA